MPTSKARYEHASGELSRFAPQLSYSVPKMYVAAEMSNDDFSRLYDSEGAWKLHNRDLSRGEIACALSHQSALREFLSTNEECCCIVEDDVVLSPYVGTFLEGLELWFQTMKSRSVCVVLSEASAVRYWAARKWIGTVRRTVPIDVVGALAYVVNRAGAKAILKVNPVPIVMTSDNWSYYRRHGVCVYGTDKILAGSSDYSRNDSSLSEGRALVYQESLSKRKKEKWLRRKWRAGMWWAVRFGRILTGVSFAGENRSNERIYRYMER